MTTAYPAIFLSTPSARRATTALFCVGGKAGISIHALREEGDPKTATQGGISAGFLSTPSARRATKIVAEPFDEW